MPEFQSYRTISSHSRGEYREKGSKFLAFAYPVSSEEDVTIRLDQLRKEYYDARHHCYGYILGNDGSRFRANDDGEPGHSAGDPILGQIRSRNLTNTLVVVIRYFGGVKLGVSGLIHAYRTAASEALDSTKIREVPVMTKYTISYAYDATSEVMRMVDDLNAEVINQEFTEKCLLTLAVNVGLAETVPQRVELLKNLGHDITMI